MTGIDSLVAYRASMALASDMLSKGIITSAEYDKIDLVILRKYGLKNDDIYCRNPLIIQGNRANMSATERGSNA